MILSSGQILNDRYKIDSVIGQGGMSYVYRARDEKLGRWVAIKVLKEEYCDDQDFIRKFQNEAQAAAKLNHPNIVAAYDVVDDEERHLHYIVMELVEGITLKEYIRRKGRLDNEETIGIALQVADGMEQAHKMGIVHRDIKPQNMIVGTDGVVKVSDFGIARAATQQTINATVIGSVHYISPEQAKLGISDERSDIYSFGCTMYEMLTGRVPYDGDTSVAVVFSQLESPVPHVRDLAPEVYPALDYLVYKCMQKKPELRYQHVWELSGDLKKALEDPEGGSIFGEDEDAALGQKRHDSSDNPANHRIVLLSRAAAVTCLLVLAGLLVYLFFQIFSLAGGGAIETKSVSTTEAGTTGEISITISGLESALPSIIGKTIPEAEEFLSDYDVKLEKAEEVYSDRYNEGMITAYDSSESPSPGATIPVTVSKGPATLSFYNASDPSDLSQLQSTSFEDLQKQLQDRNIEFDVEYEDSDSVPKGNVIRTNKPDTSGTTKLVLTVSNGMPDDMAMVPLLLGSTEEDAVSALEKAGLKAGIISTESSEEDAGTVIDQEYQQNTELSKGTTVDFTVSAGKGAAGSTKAQTGDSWHGSINQTLMIGHGGPGINDSMLITIRLRQEVNGESRYTTLQSARSYPLGTELQVVFPVIAGYPGVPTGVVEVVDAENDVVLGQFDVNFSGD